MDRKSLRQINLNFLPMLREILLHQSITKAAVALNLTPPALSNSLRQLRLYFNDELIVRQGRDMKLTLKGQRLFGPLDEALAALQSLFDETAFDAQQSSLEPEIAMADPATSFLLPWLSAIFADQAPLMTPHFVGVQKSLADDFATGKTNLIVGPSTLPFSLAFTVETTANIGSAVLWAEPMVCIGHRDDAELSEGLGSQAYLARPQAIFDMVRGANVAVGMPPSSASGGNVFVNRYDLIPEIVCATRHLALVPLSVALKAAQHYPIQYVEPPVSCRPFEMMMYWRHSDENHAGLAWIRNAIIESADKMTLTSLAAAVTGSKAEPRPPEN